MCGCEPGLYVSAAARFVPMLTFRSSDFQEAFAICSVSDALSPHPSITVWNRVSAVALSAVLARYWLEDFGGTTI
jgi:hypothetical protein